MFTGLVGGIGTVKRISRGQGTVLEIEHPFGELTDGESIAVNGVCLTVAKFNSTRFTADVLDETLARTNLGDLFPGCKVNLERALKAGDAMGGHIVQGHVDTVGVIIEKSPKGRDYHLTVRSGRVLAAQSVLKGSITIDGVSLTITALGNDTISVDLIPTTMKDTILGLKKVGDKVNLEGDIIGKYVTQATKKEFSYENLINAGFIS